MTLVKNPTTAPVEIPPRVITAPIEPQTIRLPKPGDRDPYFGLSRSMLNLLILPTRANSTPPVKSFVLRQRGKRVGVRLISFQSLKQYVHSQAASVEAAT